MERGDVRARIGEFPSHRATEEVVAVLTTAQIGTTGTSVMTAATTHAHESHHGFCTVCGSVWPCARARRTTTLRAAPVPRADALAV